MMRSRCWFLRSALKIQFHGLIVEVAAYFVDTALAFSSYFGIRPITYLRLLQFSPFVYCFGFDYVTMSNDHFEESCRSILREEQDPPLKQVDRVCCIIVHLCVRHFLMRAVSFTFRNDSSSED